MHEASTSSRVANEDGQILSVQAAPCAATRENMASLVEKEAIDSFMQMKAVAFAQVEDKEQVRSGPWRAVVGVHACGCVCVCVRVAPLAQRALAANTRDFPHATALCSHASAHQQQHLVHPRSTAAPPWRVCALPFVRSKGNPLTATMAWRRALRTRHAGPPAVLGMAAHRHGLEARADHRPNG